MIVSALRMYRLTNDPQYLAVFESTFDFIDTPRWSTGRTASGMRPSPPRGGPGRQGERWKAGYHNGRSMIECMEILKRWAK